MKKIRLEKFNIDIVYKPMADSLGYFDESTGEICINEDLSDVGKDTILIHEFLHLTASGLKQHGVIKKLPSHDFITNASQQLLGLFVESGKWKGIEKSKIQVSPHPTSEVE
jgi:hypothetical protein